MYDRNKKEILAFQHSGKVGQQQAEKIEAQLGDPGLDELLTKSLHDTLSEDIELLDGAAYEFNLDKVRHGMLTPVFFGSALTNFGVEPFLADFLRLSPPPPAAGFLRRPHRPQTGGFFGIRVQDPGQYE